MKVSTQMLHEIEMEVRYTRRFIGKDALDERVMAAMAEIPRHEFIPAQEQARAYANGPLPIGCGQTISQPYIVALMTDLLEPQPDDVMLEVGTGSGYQAAILAQVVKRVYSIEVIPELASEAVKRLRRLGYANIETRQGDGYDGWPEHAPYDGIVVTAAAPGVPQPLIDQLKPGARMVIPVGRPYSHQELMLLEKDEKGALHSREVLGVAFVPLTRERE